MTMEAQAIAIAQESAAPANLDTVANDGGPLPMSFPAILRPAGLPDRFAHLRSVAEKPAAAVVLPKKNRRDDKEGKRWVRRKENARFIGNAHIVLPSKRDFFIPPPSVNSTFPHPLPHYLSRNNAVPAALVPAREPSSANAGRFSLSMKGMRRELRKHGPRTEGLVRDVESELIEWLHNPGVLVDPDTTAEMHVPGVPIGSNEVIREVSRTPLQLVWSISDDAFTRYVVHCCARYHDVVSFSKDTSGERLTYLLRPNVSRPSYSVSALETPPVTDLSEFSELSTHEVDTESDFVSDRDARSDAGADSEPDGPNARALDAISERSDASAPPSPALGPTAYYVSRAPPSDDGWSVIGGDTDGGADADDSEEEQLAYGVGAIALDRTPRAEPRVRQVSLRAHLWERGRRSASSPSRSPARRPVRRVEPLRVEKRARRSFYDYLYS